MKIYRVFTFLLLLSLLIPLSGCATLRAMWPGGVTAADAEWSGVVSGPTVPATSLLGGSQIPVDLSLLLKVTGQDDPLGVFLPLTMVGETSPRWVLCSGSFASQCQSFKLNQTVNFAGRAIGPGLLWTPKRLK